MAKQLYGSRRITTDDEWCCDGILLDRQPSSGQMVREVICTDVANKRQESKRKKSSGLCENMECRVAKYKCAMYDKKRRRDVGSENGELYRESYIGMVCGLARPKGWWMLI